jgi:hypothetical protein
MKLNGEKKWRDVMHKFLQISRKCTNKFNQKCHHFIIYAYWKEMPTTANPVGVFVTPIQFKFVFEYLISMICN